MNDFQGTPEEIRISIANADLSLARGDVEGTALWLRWAFIEMGKLR